MLSLTTITGIPQHPYASTRLPQAASPPFSPPRTLAASNKDAAGVFSDSSFSGRVRVKRRSAASASSTSSSQCVRFRRELSRDVAPRYASRPCSQMQPAITCGLVDLPDSVTSTRRYCRGCPVPKEKFCGPGNVPGQISVICRGPAARTRLARSRLFLK